MKIILNPEDGKPIDEIDPIDHVIVGAHDVMIPVILKRDYSTDYYRFTAFRVDSYVQLGSGRTMKAAIEEAICHGYEIQAFTNLFSAMDWLKEKGVTGDLI